MGGVIRSKDGGCAPLVVVVVGDDCVEYLEEYLLEAYIYIIVVITTTRSSE